MVASRADVVQAQAQLYAAQAQWTEVDIARAQLEHAIATLAGASCDEVAARGSSARVRLNLIRERCCVRKNHITGFLITVTNLKC